MPYVLWDFGLLIVSIVTPFLIIPRHHKKASKHDDSPSKTRARPSTFMILLKLFARIVKMIITIKHNQSNTDNTNKYTYKSYK